MGIAHRVVPERRSIAATARSVGDAPCNRPGKADPAGTAEVDVDSASVAVTTVAPVAASLVLDDDIGAAPVAVGPTIGAVVSIRLVPSVVTPPD